MILDIIKLVISFGLMIAGFIVRFQPMPAQAVGVGMMILGLVLLVYWGRRRRAKVAAGSPPTST